MEPSGIAEEIDHGVIRNMQKMSEVISVIENMLYLGGGIGNQSEKLPQPGDIVSLINETLKENTRRLKRIKETLGGLGKEGLMPQQSPSSIG